MPGRRWSDGLHQAVEAKEHNGRHPEVKIERENQTLATVTFQNYFRKYKKLSGMTGTADTEAEEFAKIYKLDVVVIPPNRKLLRIENPDLVYRTENGKVGRDRHGNRRRSTRKDVRFSSAPCRSRSRSGCRRCSTGAASSEARRPAAAPTSTSC